MNEEMTIMPVLKCHQWRLIDLGYEFDTDAAAK